ncbi:MAG: hypothetical protein BJ554DRAFT_6465 [Olpidium bornovanus]|uniref:Uncharacterized protein n=1 Tax=Olpidium bornovanus TaxID=278681 RepID=A0A8H7ZXW0_9FUNG|nr:MAG: hypothetical protein BJ554DRAFT_6465 [Olpidium bornovanus]
MSVVSPTSPGDADEDERPVLEGTEHYLGRQPPQQSEPPAPRLRSRLRSLRNVGGARPSYTYQPSRLRISLSDSVLLNLLDRDDDESGSGGETDGESSSAWDAIAAHAAADDGALPTQIGLSAFPAGDAALARGSVRTLTDPDSVLQRRHSDPELSFRAGERRFTAGDLQELCAQKLSNPSLQQGLHRQLLLHRLGRRFSAEEARLRQSQHSARRRRKPPPVKPLVDFGPSPNSSVWQLDGPASAPAQTSTTSGRRAKMQAKDMQRTKSGENAVTGHFPPRVLAGDVVVKNGFRERLLTMLDVIPSSKSAYSRKIADNPLRITGEPDKPAQDQPLSPAKRAAQWQFLLKRISGGDVVVGTEKFAGSRRREPEPETQLALPPAGAPEIAREAGVDEPDGGKTVHCSANVSSRRTGDVDDNGGGIGPRNTDHAEQRLHPRGLPAPQNCEGAQKLGSATTGRPPPKSKLRWSPVSWPPPPRWA